MVFVVCWRAMALCSRPTYEWSLVRLAREIGVSRASLAERFSELIGQPPMRYLTRWRIQLACRLLCDDGTKVSAVALDVELPGARSGRTRTTPRSR